MAYPYGPQDVIPYGMLPQSEDDFGMGPEEMGFADLQAPQEPLPQDFFARLAQASGPQPFQRMSVGNKPTGLEVLLALAGGFVNAKAGQGAQRTAAVQDRNTQAREAAKTLANWRHAERLAKQRAKENRELIGMRAEAKPPTQSEYEKTRDRIKAFKEAGLPVPGTQPRAGSSGVPKPSTGQQKSIMGFYLRGKESVDTVSAPEPDGQSLEDKVTKATIIEQGRMKFAPNMLKSDEQQRYTQAQRAFTEARLRKESGAAINASEYENDAKIYFGQPGDKAPVLAQKKRLRQKVLDGLKFGAGPAFDEYYNGQQAPDGLSEEDAYRLYLEMVGGGQ